MRTLHGKFFLIIGALVLTMGATAFLLQLRSVRAYSLAMTQALNESLAQQLAEAYTRDASTYGLAQTPGAQSSQVLMLHGFSASSAVYILDLTGRIRAATTAPADLHRTRVDLEPVLRFLKHRFMYPLLGDDPRSPDARTIFSTAPLHAGQANAGYLYVVLSGPEHDALANRLQTDLLFRGALTLIGVGAGVALVAGLVVLVSMTRRLRLLAGAIDTFRDSQFQSLASVRVGGPGTGDELDRLGGAYNSMVQHIQQQMKKIAGSDALRRDLIAGVSHDLRTPLASLRGYVETLQLKESTLTASERRNYLQIVASQSERLHRLVEELFELAKLQDLEVKILRERFSASELVQDIVQKFSLAAREKSLEVRATLTPQSTLMFGDISLIERLLDNLLENAIRHTSTGRIEIGVSAALEMIIIVVADTGCGIPADVVPHIFERFYVNNTRGPSSGGSGLGLAIVKRIVDLHGGSISVRSQIGDGTIFEVRLPSCLSGEISV